MIDVCVAIPIYKNFEDLHLYEQVSLQQCFKILSSRRMFFFGPSTIKWNDYLDWARSMHIDIQTRIFGDHYFEGVGGYSRLLISPKFYKSFRNFKNVLIYQTDAFIFSDDLTKWCNQDFDFIGAPWFSGFSHLDENAGFIKGGNGGFSLRNIESHLRVLRSFSYISNPVENWKARRQNIKSFKTAFNEAVGFMLDLFSRNNTFSWLNSFRGFEDQFWCLVAAKNFTWFKIPDASDSMKFAFEMQPARVFAINDNHLPMGCHAWWKYDLAFWKPFIEDFGYHL